MTTGLTSTGGVTMFIDRHPETDEVYDIKHMAACLLKARLEKDERWKSFASHSGLAKSAIQQTELAFLVPPCQRSKARFMNLHELVKWGRETLALIDDPCRLEAVPFNVSMERVRTKLGWLVEFREALAEWSPWHEVIAAALNFVRCRCLYVGAGVDMAAALPAVSASTAMKLREELIRFVTVESSKVRIGERLPGTTAVLESCFGKLKGLEDGQSKSGFTGLVLSLGAMVSKLTIETIAECFSDVGLRTSGTGAERSSEYRFNPCENRLMPSQNAQQIPDEREVGTRPSFHHVSLGLAGVTIHRLGNRGRGMFDGVHKNRGEPTFKTFIGQVSRQSHSMGPNSMG